MGDTTTVYYITGLPPAGVPASSSSGTAAAPEGSRRGLPIDDQGLLFLIAPTPSATQRRPPVQEMGGFPGGLTEKACGFSGTDEPHSTIYSQDPGRYRKVMIPSKQRWHLDQVGPPKKDPVPILSDTIPS